MSRLLCFFFVAFLSACATPYESSGLLGGFKDKELEPGIWRVAYDVNGYISRETAQVYWLYHAAELTLAQGFQGFEVISVERGANEGRSPAERVRIAASAPIVVPIVTGGGGAVGPRRGIEADIRLIHPPLAVLPPRRFDAAELRRELDPLVNGEKCDRGNVCPHVHRYLLPQNAR